jgi:hypothetical protein
MNLRNLPHGCFSLTLFALLAMGTMACGAAPDPGTPADDPSASEAVIAPPSETPSDPAGADAAPAAQPPVDEEMVDPSLPDPAGTAERTPGGGHPDPSPREK